MRAIDLLQSRLEEADDIVALGWLEEIVVEMSLLRADLADYEEAIRLYNELFDDDEMEDFNPWDGQEIYGEGIVDDHD